MELDPNRVVRVHQILRYSRNREELEAAPGDYRSFWSLQQTPLPNQRLVMLESGINGVAALKALDSTRVPLVALRSSPWKVGQESTPWHDEFDLDHGHVRYFGDHKVTTEGPVGATRGNGQLLQAWARHASGQRSDRLLAPPMLVFRAVPVVTNGRRREKGHVEFCGVSIIEQLEFVLQRDPRTGRTFPNLVVDLCVLDLGPNDELDWRWLDDRRDPQLTAEATLKHAPRSWRDWVEHGRTAVPQIRRRVLSSRLRSRRDQLPPVGSTDEEILQRVYRKFDDDKHAFEWLASRIAERILARAGSRYVQGWLTKAGGDGGLDFVGRLDVGSTKSATPLIVLGQAKCIAPWSSVGPDQVARLVARLRRGWIGVYVTTGTFSQQAQVEMVDDEYPVVLVPGGTLAEVVHQIAEESYNGDLDALLTAALTEYPMAVTRRRPTEILGAG